MCADAAWTAVEALLDSGDYASEEFAGEAKPVKASSIPGDCPMGRPWLASACCCLLLHVREWCP